MAVVVRQDHRTTDRTTELVLLQRCLDGIEIIGRIECIVAKEFPNGTVKLVGSGLGDHIYDSTEDLPELGLVIVRLDLELLNVIESGRHSVGIANGAVIIHAI